MMIIDEVITNFSQTSYIIEFVITVVLMMALSIFIACKIKRLTPTIFYIICDVIFILAYVFDFMILAIVTALIIIGGSVVFLYVNSGILRSQVAIPLNKKSKSSKSKKAKFDKERLIENILTAVKWLSANKTGALITFERQTPLDEFIKDGTVINCPVTPEIIETIFYEGTRLHDGAIVIRDDIIVAAAVYYPPTTKAVLGKFGARHRAALGISEITDAITIVVSEETGRISITHGGLIDHIKEDEFEQILRNQLSD